MSSSRTLVHAPDEKMWESGCSQRCSGGRAMQHTRGGIGPFYLSCGWPGLGRRSNQVLSGAPLMGGPLEACGGIKVGATLYAPVVSYLSPTCRNTRPTGASSVKLCPCNMRVSTPHQPLFDVHAQRAHQRGVRHDVRLQPRILELRHQLVRTLPVSRCATPSPPHHRPLSPPLSAHRRHSKPPVWQQAPALVHRSREDDRRMLYSLLAVAGMCDAYPAKRSRPAARSLGLWKRET